MDGRAWWAAVHGVAKSRTRLSDFTFTFHFHALEKEVATHSSVPAWRIPGTGEPGGLPIYGVTQSRTRLKPAMFSSENTGNFYLVFSFWCMEMWFLRYLKGLCHLLFGLFNFICAIKALF